MSCPLETYKQNLSWMENIFSSGKMQFQEVTLEVSKRDLYYDSPDTQELFSVKQLRLKMDNVSWGKFAGAANGPDS